MNNLAGSTVYLCGAIDRAEDFGTGWREVITPFLKRMGIICLDPLKKPIDDGLEDANNVKKRRFWKQDESWSRVSEHMKVVRQTDLAMVDIATFLIVNIDLKTHACGTYEELFWANRCKKPVLVHLEDKRECPDWLFGTIPHEMIFEGWAELRSFLIKVDQGSIYLDKSRWKLFNLMDEQLGAIFHLAENNSEIRDKILKWSQKNG